MAFKVRPRDIVRLLGEAKYLEELAYTTMESFDHGRYWVASERERHSPRPTGLRRPLRSSIGSAI